MSRSCTSQYALALDRIHIVLDVAGFQSCDSASGGEGGSDRFKGDVYVTGRLGVTGDEGWSETDSVGHGAWVVSVDHGCL